MSIAVCLIFFAIVLVLFALVKNNDQKFDTMIFLCVGLLAYSGLSLILMFLL